MLPWARAHRDMARIPKLNREGWTLALQEPGARDSSRPQTVGGPRRLSFVLSHDVTQPFARSPLIIMFCVLALSPHGLLLCPITVAPSSF